MDAVTTPTLPPIRNPWLAPLLRTAVLAAAGALVWTVAGHWDRWMGAARHQSSADAYVTGDLTPLSAKVSGYIQAVALDDFQRVRKGDLIALIEPSDYRAQLDLAEAGVASAQAALANLANQRDVQRALVNQAQAAIAGAAADVTRTRLEAARQRDLLRTGIAGTGQKVEQADADAAKAVAQAQLAAAQLAQQQAQLAGLDVQERQLTAQVRANEAQRDLARDNLAYTRVVAPAERD
ncbi:HlyD family secretion protein, partial [Azospirillum sp. B4]|uniref:HlyD family secretion protein n=1 Tax=Azospirillum sp. B4 TaxID=95605 RepID=UPI00207900DD